ncbi:hypothetical protein TIFTF001_022414 [Ficus carica]|uniref:Uncharacterized protein n=1 Tax=Ficus carica TaxID=3494 RepID=A0AA88ALZ8_FICCA|nr:hypothetical protein TIFTF001_022414 [Ficus carica]
MNGEEEGGDEFGDGGEGLCSATAVGLEFVYWGVPRFLSSLSPSPEIGDREGV